MYTKNICTAIIASALIAENIIEHETTTPHTHIDIESLNAEFNYSSSVYKIIMNAPKNLMKTQSHFTNYNS